MLVTKRDGTTEPVSLDKITNRLVKLKDWPTCLNVDPMLVAVQTVQGLYDTVSTYDLDMLASEISAAYAVKHPDFSVLAARIAVSNLHKETCENFSDVVENLYNYINPETGIRASLVSDDFYFVVKKHAKELDTWPKHERDYQYDYFGFKTLEKSYLLKTTTPSVNALPSHTKVVERPQHMLMRVAVGIHFNTWDDVWLEEAKRTYELLSKGFFIHATPTLFNAGTPLPQLSSCFLLDVDSDSLDGIYKTLTDCARISKHAGGIGVAMHKIRAKDSYISGTNGKSNGLVSMLRVYNSTARYVDQGGGKRKGSIAIYLEPWHADIQEVLDLKKNSGAEEHRARDLFYALWVPDLFMKRVVNDLPWSLFCPQTCVGLYDVYGEEFEVLYTQYEQKGLARSTVSARALMTKIVLAQMETGNPYILFKDTINKTSNQKNLGTIKSSNLCTEICQYTNPQEIAVCNLASICLPKFLKSETVSDADGTKTIQKFDHKMLESVVSVVVNNLNKVIDKTYYPVFEARTSNKSHRPIGIGVQGLADVFALLRIPFDSQEAACLNIEISETIYFAALSASNKLAKTQTPYSSFKNSPLSKGLFHFDLTDTKPVLSKRWDWENLRNSIQQHGVRNSLLVALMPTASTSQIMGNNDAFEPFSSNIYTRRLLAGEFVVLNKHLVNDLLRLNLWTDSLREALIQHNGSVQQLDIPSELKELYKTAFEIPPKHIIDMARDRQHFVDQSQSMNIFIENPVPENLIKMHVYSWKMGLKTGLYYLRTKPSVNAVKVTTAPILTTSLKPPQSLTGDDVRPYCNRPRRSEIVPAEDLSAPDDCFACSS